MNRSPRFKLKDTFSPRLGRLAKRQRPVRLRPWAEGLEERVVLSMIVWTGKGDGTSFSQATNWQNNIAPGAADDAVINIAGNPTVQLPNGGATVHSLSVTSDTLDLSSGTLTTTTGLTLSSATFNFTGGSITGPATLTSSTLNLAAGAGSASFLVAPGSSLLSGPIAANEPILVAGGSTGSGAPAPNLPLATGATTLVTIT
jgi:adhesin HecA-like repeat protein